MRWLEGRHRGGAFKRPPPLLALLLVTLISTPVSAEDQRGDRLETGTLPRYVRLALPLCEELPFESNRLTEVLQIELLGDGVGFAREPEEAEALLAVDALECPSGNQVVIRIEVLESGRSSRRELQLEGGPGQERIVALALAELLRREWVTLSTDVRGEEPSEEGTDGTDLSDEEQEVVDEPIEGSQTEEGSDEAEPRFLVDIQADGRVVPAFKTGLVGARLGLSTSPRVQWLRIEADLGGWYGIAVDPLGYVDLLNVTGGVSVLFGNRIGTTFAALGPRVELGWCWARGRPFDEATLARSVNALFLVLAIHAAFRIGLSDRLAVLIGSTIGYIVAGLEAQADARVASGLKGLILGLGLGVSLRP